MRYLLIPLILFIYSQKGPPLAEKYIYSSVVFKEFAASHGLPEPRDAVDALAINKNYIHELRMKQSSEKIQNYYLGTDLTASYKKFLEPWIPPYQEGNFPHYLRESLAALKHCKKSKTTFSDDSSSEGNLPFLQFTLPKGVKVVRMGLPMIEKPYFQNLLFAPTINPEFLIFVREQKKHLYVNLMKREGLEAPYTKALEALQIPGLVVVTLDKNTDFYWQNGRYPSSWPAFKALFYQKMKDPEGAYFLPEGVDLISAMETVYHQFFKKEELTVEDRRDLIELTYLEILDQLVALYDPASINITCKHAIDRGPSLAVLWQLKWGLADEQTAAALLLAPPLLMHNRAPHESRVERFISSSKFLLSEKKGRG